MYAAIEMSSAPRRHHCSCGRSYDAIEFVALKAPGLGVGCGLVYRQCKCGSTITEEQHESRCLCCGRSGSGIVVRGAELCDSCWTDYCAYCDAAAAVIR